MAWWYLALKPWTRIRRKADQWTIGHYLFKVYWLFSTVLSSYTWDCSWDCSTRSVKFYVITLKSLLLYYASVSRWLYNTLWFSITQRWRLSRYVASLGSTCALKLSFVQFRRQLFLRLHICICARIRQSHNSNVNV